MTSGTNRLLVLCCFIAMTFTGCDQQSPQVEEKTLKVRMILDTGGDQDHGFNEYSLKGASDAAREAGIEFEYVASESTTIYERNIEKVIAEGADLVFTVGFSLANATAKAARRYPDRHFVIMDYAYFPGKGCPETVSDCYSAEGGLSNVTSLIFTEDQPAYLAGALAGCMSQTGTIGIVAGYEIPPVVRFVEGFENGARWANPQILSFKRYIPDFNDPATGQVVAKDFISKGADVIFCAGGSTGLGGLREAKDANIMAIGVDVDQYLTFPEAGSALITSVMKNVDVAAAITVKAFADKSLKSGIQSYDLAQNAVGLAPFHDWQDRIPQQCQEKVSQARERILANPSLSLRQ